MPPIRNNSAYTRENQEVRLLLAIQALKNDEKLSDAQPLFLKSRSLPFERAVGVPPNALLLAQTAIN
jgi:hypothetical protein